MPDREKLIKGWETVLSRDPLDAPWDLIDETLTLLKEQENSIPISWFEQYTRLKCSESWHNMALAIIETWKTVNNIQKKTNAK